MSKRKISAAKLHENVPPDWYYSSIKENYLQRIWHKSRFREVKKISERVDGKVLDIGSADGVFTKVILEGTKAKKVIGIDVLKSSVVWANKHWKRNKRLKFKVGDAHKLDFKAGEFDAVFSLEVLEHVEDPKKTLKEIKRVLRKGGYAVFLVPTDIWYFKLLWDNFWTKTRGKIWNDTHLHSYTNSSLIDLARSIGFQIEDSKKFMLGMLHLIKVRKE